MGEAEIVGSQSPVSQLVAPAQMGELDIERRSHGAWMRSENCLEARDDPVGADVDLAER